MSGLSDKDKKAHDKHLEKGSKKSDSDKSAYKQSPADKKAKTKTSVHTKKFKQMYGEDYLNEKINWWFCLSPKFHTRILIQDIITQNFFRSFRNFFYTFANLVHIT